jgi:hypothetical protein
MPTACRLYSPKLEEAVVAPRSPHPNISRPQGLCFLVGTRQFKPARLSHRYPQLATQCHEPATIHASEHQAPGLANLLAPGGFPPHKAWRPSLPTVPDSKRILAPLSKNKNARFPTEGRKAKTCYSAGSTRSPASPRHPEAQCFTLHLPAGESCLSYPRVGIPAPPLSGNLLLCWC